MPTDPAAWIAANWPIPAGTAARFTPSAMLAQLVLGSYKLQAAEKAKQIEGQVVKPAPPAIETKALPADNAESEHLPLQRGGANRAPAEIEPKGLNSGQLADRASDFPRR
jgi:hypothetical protein